MLQNLLYFWNTKTNIVFCLFFISCCIIFPLMNALVYVNKDQRIHQGKNKIACYEKRGKKDIGFQFSYSKNMAIFEALLQVISSSINLLLLKSARPRKLRTCYIGFSSNFQSNFRKKNPKLNIQIEGRVHAGFYMIGYGRRKIISKFPPFCRLNEENQERENSNHQMTKKTKTFLFSFAFEFPALEVPRS